MIMPTARRQESFNLTTKNQQSGIVACRAAADIKASAAWCRVSFVSCSMRSHQSSAVDGDQNCLIAFDLILPRRQLPRSSLIQEMCRSSSPRT